MLDGIFVCDVCEKRAPDAFTDVQLIRGQFRDEDSCLDTGSDDSVSDLSENSFIAYVWVFNVRDRELFGQALNGSIGLPEHVGQGNDREVTNTIKAARKKQKLIVVRNLKDKHLHLSRWR